MDRVFGDRTCRFNKRLGIQPEHVFLEENTRSDTLADVSIMIGSSKDVDWSGLLLAIFVGFFDFCFVVAVVFAHAQRGKLAVFQVLCVQLEDADWLCNAFVWMRAQVLKQNVSGGRHILCVFSDVVAHFLCANDLATCLRVQKTAQSKGDRDRKMKHIPCAELATRADRLTTGP